MADRMQNEHPPTLFPLTKSSAVVGCFIDVGFFEEQPELPILKTQILLRSD
jgi:hypothetical protein